MCSLLARVRQVSAPPNDSIRLSVLDPSLLESPADQYKDGPSWMIVDSNETPGGLASTDVTKEGFVHLSTHSLRDGDADMRDSCTMLVAMSSFPTTSTSTTASTKLSRMKTTGIRTRE